MERVLVYVIIINDRHEDIDIEVFLKKEAAVSRAKVIVEERMSDGYEDEGDCFIDECTVFNKQYSTEGDYVCVVERKLQ